MDDCTRYWKLANRAIKEGLITYEEARTIARVGTRKQAFWKRHIKDIEKIIECRLEDTPDPTTSFLD